MEFIIKEKKSERLEISGEDQRSREISRRWEVGRERREIRTSERERERVLVDALRLNPFSLFTEKKDDRINRYPIIGWPADVYR